MIKTFSQNILKIYPKPTYKLTGIWNHFSKSEVVSSNIKFDIYYKECIDTNRKESIDRYYSLLNLKFNNTIYHEESFYFDNKYAGPNCNVNYFDYVLLENSKSICYDQINPLVFKKINTFIIANQMENFLAETKSIIRKRKLYPGEKQILCDKYLLFCEELEKSIITKHIGIPSKKMIRIDKYEVSSIIKEYNLIEPIIKSWSKITGRDLLTDRLYNIYLDFLLVG